MNLESGYLTAMRAEYQRLTGALPGEDSDIGIRMALLANQLELLEEELGALRQAADPETAEGEMLDRHADSRGLRRKEAAAAGGVLRFYRKGAAAQEIVLPQGLVASTAGAEPVRFVTTAEGRIAAGETEALVPAQAEQPGSTGNAAAGSITVLVTAVGSVDGVENPEGFSGGQDAETDDELRSRLLESYHAVSNGSNAAYYRRLALAQDGVASVQVIQRPRGSGSVDLVIAGEGAAASEDTVRELGELVAQQRELGVDAQVTAAKESPCPVTLELFAGENYAFDDVKTQAEAALRALFGELAVGQPLYIARIIGTVMAVPGVENCRLTAPAADQPGAERSLITLGELTVTKGAEA